MSNEAIIKKYYSGWESSDWAAVESTLADDFTFTSPFDDHIDIRTYKERCWPGADSIGTYNFHTIIEKGNEAFAKWSCLIGGKMITNTEYFRIQDGKIQAVEVYFGTPAK